MLLYTVIAVLLLLYGMLMYYYKIGWNNLIPFKSETANYTLRVSIIVAARNEEQTIGFLLNSLLQQTYPSHLVEIIVVDDHSTDETAKVVQQFSSVRLLQLKDKDINSYKKKALTVGITASRGDWIVTTDADCITPPNWLTTLVAFQEKKNAVLIAAPVLMNANNSILQKFQALDFLTLLGITAASVQQKFHAMCNGANLSYSKKVFEEVGGFSAIDHIASGDDFLLMHKIEKKYPDNLFFLYATEAIVSTQPQSTWKDFLQQRIRWASKAKHYKDKRMILVLALVYGLNCFLFAAFIFCFFEPQNFLLFLSTLVVKAWIESILVTPVLKFYHRKDWLKYLYYYQPLHIIYIILSGWFGFIGKFEWKGRFVK